MAGVAGAVPVLVVVEGHLRGHVVPERAGALEELGPVNGVQAHGQDLVIGEAAGLLQYGVAHGDLAHVMEDGGRPQHVAHLADLAGGDPPTRRPVLVELHGVGAHALGVLGGLEGIPQLRQLHHAQYHLARQPRLLDGVRRVQGELGDEKLVLYREGHHLSFVIRGVDELQDPDDLIVARLQRHAEDGAGAVIGFLVEGRVEGIGDAALDVIDVVDEDGLSRFCHVAGEGALVDCQRRAAGDVLVLGLAAEQGVVLDEAEVEISPGRQVDGAGIRADELPGFREHPFKQGVEVPDGIQGLDGPE